MEKKIKYLLLILMLPLGMAGCAAPPLLLVGGVAAATAGAGTYMYLEGDMSHDFKAPFDRVWSACEKTVAQMRGVEVKPVREIGKGVISALIKAERTTIQVYYKTKDVTSVSVRVGTLGDRHASRVILDRILDNLGKN